MIRALNGLLMKAKDIQLVRDATMGRGDSTVEISHLFFPDETLIFCQSEESILSHLRCVLLSFQVVSGFNINLKKSELVRIGDKRDEVQLAGVDGVQNCQPFDQISRGSIGGQVRRH